MQVIEAQRAWSWRLTITSISSMSELWQLTGWRTQIGQFCAHPAVVSPDLVAAHGGGYGPLPAVD
jgi:hypothetical protein